MTLKEVNQLNPIGAMETFTKPNCNFFYGRTFNNPKKAT